ncbi:DUF1702 family protein [Lentzea sp. BCCO 10_0798]|uniref:DUF1702 family protein n=1 Tax=Lentzea kristufekii TaxID=3095430 RepID=A0ABU4TMR9_9PSEU|nr:DUF1702 family protein [Lentzea sp. BCCO 10_0798]MDX8049571.1 DUF1702 family protein [Lentzea sp. BCCO 10_0798]
MSTVLGSIRRLVFTPKLADVTFSARGFSVPESETTRALEQIPQTVITGFEWGIDCRSLWELERRLSLVEPGLRGFAYEGATMACTVLDAMDGRKRTRDLLRGPGLPHLFLAYIGIGFAMARLPRPLWRKVVPDLDGVRYHPAITWLAVDGYGFDRAYFHPKRWVAEQEPPKPYPWQDMPSYFPRAFDQGLGRALWFIHGADVKAVAGAVRAFAGHRQPDLWSGVGLAATFAGGAGPDDLAWLRAEAGDQRPELALGATLAIMAKAAADCVDDRAGQAVHALSDLSPAAAVAVVETASVPAGETGKEPEYELWRSRIKAHFTA